MTTVAAIGTILTYFDLQVTHAFYHVSSELAFRFRRRSVEKISKIAAMEAILDFRSERF